MWMGTTWLPPMAGRLHSEVVGHRELIAVTVCAAATAVPTQVAAETVLTQVAAETVLTLVAEKPVLSRRRAAASPVAAAAASLCRLRVRQVCSGRRRWCQWWSPSRW